MQYVRENVIQGYLAYNDGKIVGWCNSNTKANCLNCISWRRYMDYVPLDDIHSGIKVKSVFCFMIAPEMRKKGIAGLLLDQVCEDALHDGFDFVEAYPYKKSDYKSSHFCGYIDMYKRRGFNIYYETDKGIVMRKRLK